MIKNRYQYVGDALESLFVLVNLAEVLSELDERHSGELSQGVHDKGAIA